MYTFVFITVLFFGYCNAHPAFQHHFHRAIREDKCLTECMKIVQDSEIELSILKRANISAFLLDVDTICDTIHNASECMSKCGHKENPFNLQTMEKICEEEARKDVELLTPCLIREGNVVYKTCKDACGDYDSINNEVHEMTVAMSPNPHDTKKANEVLAKVSGACKVLKCSARCSVNEFNDACDTLSNGKDAGDTIRSLIEQVLEAQREDLEQLGLTDAMAHTVANECHYQYMPETFFNQTKDELSQLVIEEMRNSTAKPDAQKIIPNKLHLIRHQAHSEISYTLSQLNTRLIQKQFLILEEQERNLQKESKKLDLELELLENRKARNDN